MSRTPTRTAQPSTLSRAGLRRVLVILCITQITSWGILYYAFPVLASTISTRTGWSPSTVMAAFSASQVTSAVTGIPIGRWLDRWGPRPVMTGGSLLAVPALLGIATAPSVPVFVLAWIGAGAAMAAVLYQPAFAALTTWWGPRHVTALTTVTLVGGLASTVFAPLTAALVDRVDWRTTYLILTTVLAAITIPAHWFGLRGPWPRHPTPTLQAAGPVTASTVARSRPFILLTIATSLAAFAIYAVVVNQVPLLTERGLSTSTAALALGLGGAGQVCGRLVYNRLSHATGIRGRTAAILGAGAATTALLAVIPGPATLLIAAAVLAGAARGLFTLLQATAISDRWGTSHYGHLNGLMTAPVLLATALAPWAGTALAQPLGGYPIVFALLAAAAALATLLAVAATPQRRPVQPDNSVRSCFRWRAGRG